MSKTECSTEDAVQLEMFEVDRRAVTVAFDGGNVVTDTGLLLVRNMECSLGILKEAAARLPDPRSELLRRFSTEQLLTQTVYQLLGGDFDCQDADTLRRDPLMQAVVGGVPGTEEGTLASGSTLARFRYGYTRRQQQLAVDDRTIEQECQAAKCERLRVLNRFLTDLFVKTRRTPPRQIVLDFDATDDPTHGAQQLSLFHGYYEQHQYLTLLVFDADAKMPLAGWLNPGTSHASWGAVETLAELVTTLRAAWPDVEILVRADSGYAVPAMYEYCEAHGVNYVIGYASNSILKSKTELTMNYARAWSALHEEPCQFFQEVRGYQAGTWDRSRRVICKCEITAQGGPNQRFVITNLTERPAKIYQEIYVKRGDTPERAIQELKHGLGIDRLSSTRFFANAFAMQCHLLAYAIFVLFREANATVPEVANHTLETVRSKILKIGSVVNTSCRKIWFHVSASWPRRRVFHQICSAVNSFTEGLGRLWGDRVAEALAIKLDGTVTLTK